MSATEHHNDGEDTVIGLSGAERLPWQYDHLTEA
jgi:hypothetical protein